MQIVRQVSKGIDETCLATEIMENSNSKNRFIN